MKLAIHGLGKMGSQIVHKLSEDQEFTVIAHNRSPEPIEEAVSEGAIGAYSKEDILSQFEDERLILWLMLPAEIVDQTLDEWLAIIPKGSLIIDGGNSDFRETIERSKKISSAGSSFMDIGVSGGIWGYQKGFSMMCGSDDPKNFELLRKVLLKLSQPSGDFDLFGPTGSGHFVKMVHNAIEYGMMESLAEGYRIIKEGPFRDIKLNNVARVWQHGSVVTSWLNQLIEQIMNENPNLEGIKGNVAESGEARWTLELAKSLSIAMPAIDQSFKVRIESQSGTVNYATKLLSAMRNKFGGHQLNNS